MRLAKRLARFCLDKSFPVVARMVNAVLPPIIVLGYHRVAELDKDSQLLCVSPQNFASHLEWLAENYIDIVRFDEPWKINFSGTRACITFDDGYADNYLTALPILEQFGFPATFFVSTWYALTGNAYWWDVLENILYGDLPTSPPPLPFRAYWPDTGEHLYMAWHPILRDAPPDKREILIEALCAWLGVPRKAKENCRPMLPKEITELSRHPLATVGAHSHTHSRLATLDAEAQKQEIRQSLDHLESWTGKRPVVFAYPFGARGLLGRGGDFTQETVYVCKELGLFRAAANYPSQARPWTDSYAVPRHLVRNWDRKVFAENFSAFMTEGHF